MVIRKIRNSNENRMAATLSPVYEDISHDTNGGSLSRDNVGPTPTQSGQTNQTQSDYVNTPHPAEVDQEKVKDYDRLDIDVVGEGSPYSTIEAWYIIWSQVQIGTVRFIFILKVCGLRCILFHVALQTAVFILPRSTIQKNTPLKNNEVNDSNRNAHRLNVHYERDKYIDLCLRIVYTVKRVSSVISTKCILFNLV